MRFWPAIVVIVAIAFVSAAGYGAWTYVQSREAQACAACRRPVHRHSTTLAVAHGKEARYCCPACALSERQQGRTAVKLTSLTDYSTGERILPEHAWIVRGGDANMCARMTADPRPDKQPMEAHYDRCSPGLVAFSSDAAAAAFVRKHGGQLMRFATLAAAR